MEYQVTVRYGAERQRYHLFSISAPELGEALRRAAESLPEEVARTGDLVEVRPAVDPEGRSYLDEGPDPRGQPAEPGSAHPGPHPRDPGPG